MYIQKTVQKRKRRQKRVQMPMYTTTCKSGNIHRLLLLLFLSLLFSQSSLVFQVYWDRIALWRKWL